MQTKLLTIKEVAARLNVSVDTIRNWVRGCYTNGRGSTLCKVKFIEPVRPPAAVQRVRPQPMDCRRHSVLKWKPRQNAGAFFSDGDT